MIYKLWYDKKGKRGDLMKYQIKRIRDMIKVLYPYRVYQNLKRIFALLSVLMFALMVMFCLVEPKAIPFEGAGEFDYTYLDIDLISQDNYNGYYIVESGEYCYIYHHKEEGLGQDLIDLQNWKKDIVRIFGVPDSTIDEEILKGLIPIFNDMYEDPVQSVSELAYYTGYEYLDHDVTFNVYKIGICMVFTVAFFLMLWVIKGAEILYARRYNPYFQNICYRGEEKLALEELSHPRHAFYHLKAALLPNYLVCNHPVPFMIAYDDIVMIYESHRLSKEIRLVIYDRELKKQTILYASSLNPKSHEEMRTLLSYIAAQYPNILVGNTRENRAVLNQMKNDH